MASVKGTEWTNAFLTPREPDDTMERIVREFNYAGTGANDTILLAKIPAGYEVTHILIVISTTFEDGTAAAMTVGTTAYNAETGALGDVGDADCYGSAISVKTLAAHNLPNATAVSWRRAQTTDEALFLTVSSVGTGAAGVLYGHVTMHSAGLA